MSKFQVRKLQADDTEAVVAVYEAAAARDANIGPITPSQWRGLIQRPQNNGGRDFRVILHGGRLIGQAEASLRHQAGQCVRFFKLVVEPSLRRQGAGTALLREILTLDASREPVSLQTLASSDWHDGIAFLEAYGFSHIESEIGMRCSSLPALAPPVTHGFSIERCTTPSSVAEDVARLHNIAFASDASFRFYSVSEMKALLGEEGQELWIIRDASAILGYCHLEREPGSTWIEAIAIDPDRHGQGLGLALAHAALSNAGIHDNHVAALNVSSINGAARSIYRKLGFVSRRETRRYSAQHSGLNDRLSQNPRRYP